MEWEAEQISASAPALPKIQNPEHWQSQEAIS